MLPLLLLGVAQWMDIPRFNPQTWTSPSGEYRFAIEPSQSDGTGSTTYRLSKGKTPLWTKACPFLLIEGGITDDGRALGYGYENPLSFVEGSTFEVVFFDRNGAIRQRDSTKRVPSRYLHTAPDPKSTGAIFDPDHDRFVVRIANPNNNERGEDWWVYSISKAKLAEKLSPRSHMPESALSVTGATPVRGTPLTLLSWWWYKDDEGGPGQVFTLVDLQAKPVWTLVRPGDLADYTRGRPSPAVLQAFGKRGGVLPSAEAGRFNVWFLKDKQNVSFTVAPEGGDWKVREAAKVPYSPEPAPVKVPEFNLRQMGKFVVPLSTKKRRFSTIEAFQLISGNRVAILDVGEKPAIFIANRSGTPVRTIHLPSRLKAGEVGYALASCGKSIVAVISTVGEKPKAEAWRVDVATGRLSPIVLAKSATIKAAVGFSDGAFATLSNESLGHTSIEALTLFDPKGKLLWSIEGSGSDPTDLLSPEDLTLDAKGNIAVLDNIRKAVQLFDRHGKYRKSLELEGQWSPRYPTMVRRRGSGFLIEDLPDEGTVFVRTDPLGAKLGSSIEPRYPDGRYPWNVTDAQVDEGGNIWISDRSGVYRLDGKGMIATTIGGVPNDGLSEIADLFVDNAGGVYALDAFTANVHVFAPNGEPGFIARPLPADFSSRPPAIRSLRVTRSGIIYLELLEQTQAVKFSPKGKRLGRIRLFGLGGQATDQAPADAWWSRRSLRGGQGQLLTQLERWPNNEFLDFAAQVVSSPTGEVLVFRMHGHKDPRIGFFTSGGKPLAFQSLSDGWEEVYYAAYDGRFCYFVTGDRVVAVDKRGTPLWNFTPPPKQDLWAVYASKGGIALYDLKQTVYWYSLP